MTNSSRDQHIETLRKLLEVCPDMRLGQWVAVIAFKARPESGDPVYNLEDDEFLATAEEELRTMQAFHQQQSDAPAATLQTTP